MKNFHIVDPMILFEYKQPYVIKVLDKTICKKFGSQFSMTVCNALKNNHYITKIMLTGDESDWLGYVGIKKTGEISSIEVNDKYRRKGYGSILLNKVFKNDAKYLFVEEDNPTGIKFYSNSGWIQLKNPIVYYRYKPEKKWFLFYNPKNVSHSPLEVKNSNISGKGIFSNIHLEKIRGDRNHDFLLGVAFEKVKNTGNPDIDYSRTELGKYVNHSNKPNMKLFRKGNVYYYVTIKEIKPGDELTVDYRTFPWEGKRDFVK